MYSTRFLLSCSCAKLLAVFAVTLLGVVPLVAQSTEGRAVALDDVVRAVLAGHPRLDASAARSRAALGVRSTAGALPNPLLSVARESGLEPSASLPYGRESETFATATMPLDFLYIRPSRSRQADAALRSRQADSIADQTTLLFDATDAYYRAALSQVEVATTREIAGGLDSLVLYQRARVAEGAAAGIDLRRSELERDRLRADLALLSAESVRARIKLSTYLGTDTARVSPAVVPPPERLFEVAASPATWQSRPELLAARERLAAAEAGVSLAQAQIVPQFEAMVGFKQIVGVNSLVSGLSMPLPLLNQNGGAVARAKAERDEVAAELAELNRTARATAVAELEVNQLLSEQVRDFLPGAAGDDVGSRGRADELRRITVAAYREGGTSLLQLLDAARVWMDSRIAFYRTLYAQQQSAIALAVAQGGDLAIIIPRLVAPVGAPR